MMMRKFASVAPRSARMMSVADRTRDMKFNVSTPVVSRGLSSLRNVDRSRDTVAGRGEPVPGPLAHGGELKRLMVQPEDVPQHNRSMELNDRQICALELIMNGTLSPLEGFMTEKEYDSVVQTHRLPMGTLFGMPTVLDTNDTSVQVGDCIELTSSQYGGRLAVMLVESKWSPNTELEGRLVYGTESTAHPAVKTIMTERGQYCIGGSVFGLQLPRRGWVECKTPVQVRQKFHGQGNKNLVAFTCQDSIHRAHAQMIFDAARNYDTEVLVHPVIGPASNDEIPAHVRVRTYEAIKSRLSSAGGHMEYLPYSMMHGGPREALQQMLMRKNYGCTHMILGRDHAGCKVDGEDVYSPHESQEFIASVEEELGVRAVELEEVVYAADMEQYVPAEQATLQGLKVANISSTEFRRRVKAGELVPSWFAFDEVVQILRAESAADNTFITNARWW